MPTPDPASRPLPDATGLPARALGFDMPEPGELEPDLPTVDDDGLESEPREPRPMPGQRMRAWSRRSAPVAGWLLLASVVALGSAGIAAATNRSPEAGNRPELTWAADRALSARLDAAVASLVDLSADVDLLSGTTRQTRGALTTLNQADLSAAQAAGDGAVASIQRRSGELEAQLGCRSWTAARERGLIEANGPATIDRYRVVCRTLAAVAPMPDSWRALVGGSKVVMQVIGDVKAHDVAAEAAIQAAVKGRYDDALASLDQAAAAIADAQTISDQFALVTNVSTLAELLSRYREMDDALRLLWQLEKESRGRLTPEVLAAMKVVNEADALLPDTNAFIGVVAFELSGQVTADAIAIEVARGKFQAELGQLVGGTVPGGS